MRHNHLRRRGTDRSRFDTVYVDLPQCPYYRALYVDPLKTRYVNISTYENWHIDRVFVNYADFVKFCENIGAELA